MTFEPVQWVLLVVAAVFFGFSKTGIPGISMVSVGILANVIPAKVATGVVLPMLIFVPLRCVHTPDAIASLSYSS